MRENNIYAQRLYEEPRLVYRPELFLLIFFLTSIPLYQPNYNLFARLAPESLSLDFVGVASLTACLIGALALILYSLRSLSWRGFGRRAQIIGGALYVATQIACPILLWFDIGGLTAIYALSIVAGLCVIPVIVAWVRAYALDFRNMMFYGAVACLGSSLLIWIMSLLPDECILIGMPAFCLLGSAVVLFKQEPDHEGVAEVDSTAGAADAEEERGLGERLVDLLRMAWLPLLGFLFCSFLMGLYEFSMDGSPMNSECLGGIIAAVVALIVCLCQRKTPLVLMIERLIIPICVAVCLVLQSFPEGSSLFVIGAMTIYTPLILISLFALACGASFANAREFPLPLIVGIVMGLGSAVVLVSRICNWAFITSDINLGAWSWVIICILFAFIIIDLGVFAWRRATASHADEMADEKRPSDAEMQTILRMQSIDRLANEYGLTAREHEILEYMGRGYGSAYISKKLFISASTARTHCKHIYRKLGVDSRETLLIKVEEAMAEEARAEETAGH